MSKYEDPTKLDYRYGGDTVDDFAQKYMKTVSYIFSALNELRSPTGGTLTQNPEAYQLKVDDNKLYIRNQANTDWILLGDVKENFGFRTSASDAFMHESDVADSGTAGKLIRADASGKLNADILGNAAKIADKAIQMGIDLADEDRLVYDKDTDTITNRPLQFKVDGDKIYARKDATTSWVLLGDLKQNLGFRSSTDDAFLTESDVTDKGTAGKLIRADVNGKLNADILGNARKMAGKTFAPEDLQDGQIPVYRASDGTWHAENKGTVGTGKNLMIMDGDKMLGEYNGDEMKAIDIQKSSLTKALAESTGYGIVSGCEPSISGLTVTVGAGVIHLADGKRKEIVQTNITLDAADPTNPRIDLVYIDSTGTVAKITGTAAASPSVPAVPTGGISVARVSVAAGASTGTVTVLKKVSYSTNKTFVSAEDFGIVSSTTLDQTEALQNALNAAEAVGKILDCGNLCVRISSGITLGSMGIRFNKSYGSIGSPGIYATGTGYTAVTTKNEIINFMSLTVYGNGNSVNGILLQNPMITSINYIRVYNFNGYGVKINKCSDCVFDVISVEKCGNADSYAFQMADDGDTCNMSHIIRLQVEQSNQRAIYISKNTLSCVFDNIHSERTTCDDSAVTHGLNGNSCTYHNVRIEGGTNKISISNGFGVVDSLRAADANVIFGYGVFGVPTTLSNGLIKNLTLNDISYELIENTTITGQLTVSYDTSRAVCDACVINDLYISGNNATINLTNKTIVNGKISKEGSNSLYVNDSIINGTQLSFPESTYMENSIINSSFSTGYAVRIYAKNCIFNNDISLDNNLARFEGKGCNFKGNLNYTAGLAYGKLDSACVVADGKTIHSNWYANPTGFETGAKCYNPRPSANGYIGYVNIAGTVKGFGMIEA